MKRPDNAQVTPPDKPNRSAQTEWDALVEDARADKRRGFIALCVGSALGLTGAGATLYRIVRPGPAPLIAEVCRGDVLAVRSADTAPGRPRLEDIADDLNAWVRGAREVSVDMDFLRRAAWKTYNLTRKGSQAEAMLQAYHAANKPDELARTKTVKLDNQTAMPARGDPNSDTWNLEWREITRGRDGSLMAPVNWKMEVSFTLKTPDSADELRKNPRGIYVEAFQWQAPQTAQRRIAERGQ